MKKSIIIIYLLCTTLFSFSQEKKFTSFELLYDIPQEMNFKDGYYMYDPEKVKIFNDTLFTMLIKDNHISKIPLTNKAKKIENEKINIPTNSSPVSFTRFEGQWYIILLYNGLGYINKENIYTSLIPKAPKWYFQKIFFVNNQIVLFDSDDYKSLFELYDLKGNLIDSTSIDFFDFNYSTIFNNTLWDGYDQIKIDKNKIYISEKCNINKYDNEDTFIGGFQNLGYFADYEKRNKLVIRDMETQSTKDSFSLPPLFKESDLGVPEEGTINLQVFSQDNNTFYFVTLKKGHLMIYKALR